MAMTFMDFEKPLEALYEQLEKLKEVGEKGEAGCERYVARTGNKIKQKRKKFLPTSPAGKKCSSPGIPSGLIPCIMSIRCVRNSWNCTATAMPATTMPLWAGWPTSTGKRLMVIGHQKGVNTKMRQYRNFGMANPEGYRKALRLMKMAERFGFPVVTLDRYPGAFPGLEAEQRGQAEAIARNLFEMAQLKVPILVLHHWRRRFRRRIGHWPGRQSVHAGIHLVFGYFTRILLFYPLALLGLQGNRLPRRSSSMRTTCLSFGLIDGIERTARRWPQCAGRNGRNA
jgi:hypothetical protein